jgi:hypothetical protein
METVETLERAQEIGEKGVEEAKKHVERRNEIIKAICETQPEMAICRGDDGKPPDKKSKSDDPKGQGGSK